MHVEDQDVLMEIGNKIKEFYSPDSNWEDNKLAGIQVLHNNNHNWKIILNIIVIFSIILTKILTKE